MLKINNMNNFDDLIHTYKYVVTFDYKNISSSDHHPDILRQFSKNIVNLLHQDKSMYYMTSNNPFLPRINKTRTSYQPHLLLTKNIDVIKDFLHVDQQLTLNMSFTYIHSETIMLFLKKKYQDCIVNDHYDCTIQLLNYDIINKKICDLDFLKIEDINSLHNKDDSNDKDICYALNMFIHTSSNFDILLYNILKIFANSKEDLYEEIIKKKLISTSHFITKPPVSLSTMKYLIHKLNNGSCLIQNGFDKILYTEISETNLQKNMYYEDIWFIFHMTLKNKPCDNINFYNKLADIWYNDNKKCIRSHIDVFFQKNWKKLYHKFKSCFDTYKDDLILQLYHPKMFYNRIAVINDKINYEIMDPNFDDVLWCKKILLT